MASTNPYFYNHPATGQDFFGREEVFQAVERCLESQPPNVLLLHGQRRIGKTSILQQIAMHRCPSRYHAVFFDLEDEGGKTCHGVLFDLARVIAKSLNLAYPSEPLFEPGNDYFRVQFLPSIYETLQGKRLLLLLDEFEAVSTMPKMGLARETFFPYLKRLVDDEPRLAFVLAVGRDVMGLPNPIASFARRFPQQEVGRLEDKDCRRLMEDLAKPHLTYEPDAISRVLYLTQGHPLCAQVLCSELWSFAQKQGLNPVAADRVDEVVEAAVKSAANALGWIWKAVLPFDKVFLSALGSVEYSSDGASLSDVEQLLKRQQIPITQVDLRDIADGLVRAGFVTTPTPRKYGFSVDFIRRWVAWKHPVATARQELVEPESRISQLLYLAAQSSAAGDTADAENIYRQILASRPDVLQALVYLADLLYRKHDYAGAFDNYEKAFSIDQEQGRAGFHDAAIDYMNQLETQGDLAGALRTVQRIARALPDDEDLRKRHVQLLLRLGRSKRDGGDYQNAVEMLEQALKLSPSLAPARDFGEAAQQELRATHLIWLDSEASELSMSGRRREALEKYQKLAAMQPDVPKWNETVIKLTQELQLDEHFRIAMDSHKKRYWRQASDQWLELLRRLNEEHPPYYYNGVNVAMLLGEAASREAARNRASVNPIRLFRGPDGEISFAAPGQEEEKHIARLIAMPSDRLKWHEASWAISGVLVGLIIGAILALLISFWALIIVALVVVSVFLIIRRVIPRSEEPSGEYEILRDVDA